MRLQTITDSRGSLTVIERLPFEIKRVYYLHSIQQHATRGGHAHRALRRLMVAISGSFRLTLRGPDGVSTSRVLWEPTNGVLIEPMTWVELENFSSGAVCMVLASAEHDETDAIRDFAEFERLNQ